MTLSASATGGSTTALVGTAAWLLAVRYRATTGGDGSIVLRDGGGTTSAPARLTLATANGEGTRMVNLPAAGIHYGTNITVASATNVNLVTLYYQ